MVILVCAVVIKQVDHRWPGTQRQRIQKLKRLHQCEDIAVFFSDISEQYDDFKERPFRFFPIRQIKRTGGKKTPSMWIRPYKIRE